MKFAAQRFGARNSQEVLELRVPGLDAIFEIDCDDPDLQRFDDILAEIFQAFDLHGFLLERVIEASVFDGDGDVSGDGEKQFEVVAREVVAVHGLTQSEDCDGAFAETAGDEIVQVEFFESAPDGFGFLGCCARGFKEQAAAGEGWAGWVEKRKIERTFRAQTHGTGEDEAARSGGSSRKIARRSTSRVCETRSSTEPTRGSRRTSLVNARPNSIKVRR